jgi:hypothetical protein
VVSILRIFTSGLLCLSLLSVGCSKKTTSQSVPEVADYAVTCIGVLPAVTPYDFEDNVPAAEAEQLQNGIHILDQLLRQQFISRTDVRLVSDSQISGMDKNLPAQPLARARVIADRLSCNTVLETTLRRYRDRVGGELTAQEPASVAFAYRLIAIPDGTVLCSGAFDEVQKSIMENLYNFKSATERGFSWVTAEQLLKEGLQERFAECSYFAADE